MVKAFYALEFWHQQKQFWHYHLPSFSFIVENKRLTILPIFFMQRLTIYKKTRKRSLNSGLVSYSSSLISCLWKDKQNQTYSVFFPPFLPIQREKGDTIFPIAFMQIVTIMQPFYKDKQNHTRFNASNMLSVSLSCLWKDIIHFFTILVKISLFFSWNYFLLFC